MGVAMSFILGLFLRIFQIFCFSFKLSDFLYNFCRFSNFFTKNYPVALAGYGFACLFFVSPLTITSGLLGHGVLKSVKNYPQFSFFGDSHD